MYDWDGVVLTVGYSDFRLEAEVAVFDGVGWCKGHHGDTEVV